MAGVSEARVVDIFAQIDAHVLEALRDRTIPDAVIRELSEYGATLE